MQQHVYLLTLSWNGLDKLTLLKDSLLPCLTNINYTWYIRDNGSTDDTVNVVSTWNENIKVISYKNNLQNFSQGMNHLFSEANPKDDDLILLLNNDVIFKDESSLKNMIDIMQDPEVGAVGAKLVFNDNNKIQHAGVVFHPEVKMPLHFRANEISDDLSNKNRLFQVVTGAVLLTKAKYYKNAFKNSNGINGMDENYHWAFEDVDLCLAINKNMKKKIVYCGKTNIFHEESATLKKNPANKLFMSHNVIYFLNKWKDKYSIDLETYSKNSKYNLYKQG